MDPNAALARMREAQSEYHQRLSDEDVAIDALQEIAEYAEALDEWISRGGFLPSAWERAK